MQQKGIIPVRYQYVEFAKHNNCLMNVKQQVELDGGEIVLGWQVIREPICTGFAHHAVWKRPDGELRDITPHSYLLPNGLFLIKREAAEFVADPTARFEEGQWGWRSLPTFWEATVDSDAVRKGCVARGHADYHYLRHEWEKGDYQVDKANQHINRYLATLGKKWHIPYSVRNVRYGQQIAKPDGNYTAAA
jgi:hypothetical protein